MRHVVIIGGGFGGLSAARALKDAPVYVTVIDRSNHHRFRSRRATTPLGPSETRV